MARKVAKMPYRGRIDKGTKRYWRAVTFSLMAWMSVRRHLGKSLQNRRDDLVKALDNGVVLHSDIAKGWLIKAVR